MKEGLCLTKKWNSGGAAGLPLPNSAPGARASFEKWVQPAGVRFHLGKTMRATGCESDAGRRTSSRRESIGRDIRAEGACADGAEGRHGAGEGQDIYDGGISWQWERRRARVGLVGRGARQGERRERGER